MTEPRPYPQRRDAPSLGWADRFAARLRVGLWPLRRPLASLGVALQARRAMRAAAGPGRPGTAEHLRFAHALRAFEPRPGSQALRAALWLARGSLVSVASGRVREDAFALAALALAQLPGGIHLAAAVPGDAGPLHARLAPAFARAGLRLAWVEEMDPPERRRAAFAADATVAGLRALAFEHLRDRLREGEELSSLRLALRSLTAERPPAPVLRGLRRILVLDADQALLDDARATISAGGAATPLFDRAAALGALRMAAALEPGRDFEAEPGRVPALTAEGRRRAAEIPEARLSGLEAAPRRERLLALALAARNLLRRGRDYAVEGGRLVTLDPATGQPTPGRSWGSGLQQVVEAMEGLPMTPVQRAVAQLTIQRFLGRYLFLGGLAADFEGQEAELSRSYRCPCLRFGRPAPVPSVRVARDGPARLRLLARLAAEGDVIVSDDPDLADVLPAGLRRTTREAAEAGLDPAPARLLCLEAPDGLRTLDRLSRGNGGARVELVLSLRDPAFAGGRGWLLRRLWPVLPLRERRARTLLLRHVARAQGQAARLRALQVEGEHRRRAILSLAGRPV